MKPSREIHLQPDRDMFAPCGTPNVWHNWTPIYLGVTCKKCRALLTQTPEPPRNERPNAT